jgi:acetate---CoA ligase (ADP-forming) subunit beta
MIQDTIETGRTVLTEHESKQILASYGIPTSRELLVHDAKSLIGAAVEIGYPIVLKRCGQDVSHKTEKHLVRIDIRTEAEALAAFEEITGEMDGPGASVLVQEMVQGQRELMVGLTRDPQFGPCVMFGLGGIFSEILEDVVFRVAPLETKDAIEMMQGIRGHKILDAIRGMETVNRDVLANILITVGRIGLENERIKEIDVNPLIVRGGIPVAVDALIVLTEQ